MGDGKPIGERVQHVETEIEGIIDDVTSIKTDVKEIKVTNGRIIAVLFAILGLFGASNPRIVDMLKDFFK